LHGFLPSAFFYYYFLFFQKVEQKRRFVAKSLCASPCRCAAVVQISRPSSAEASA
jgi:hypothetical protein